MLRAANADGRSDLLVGAPGNGAGDLGEAVFFSGSSEQALYAYFPPSHHGGFGSKVCSVGDVDLDGLTDVAIADSTTETVEVRRSSDVYLCASPKYLSVPGTFMLGLGESKPGNVFFLFLSSVDGVPIFCPCTSIFGRFPSSGEFRRDVFVTADLAGHSVGFLAFTFNRFGKAQLYGEEHVIFE